LRREKLTDLSPHAITEKFSAKKETALLGIIPGGDEAERGVVGAVGLADTGDAREGKDG